MAPHRMLPREDDEALKDADIDRRVLGGAWGFAHPFRWSIAGFLVAIVVSALVALLPPLIFRRIIDVAIPAGDRRQIWVLGGLTVVVALTDAGLAIVQRWYSARIGEGLIYELRVALFDKVQQMPVAFFTRTQTGALISRLNNDVVGAQTAVDLDAGLRGVQRDRAGHHPDDHAPAGVEADDPDAGRAAPVHPPGPPRGPAAGGHRAGADEPQLPPEHPDDRALQRGRRHAREAVRSVRRGAPRVRPAGLEGPRQRHPLGHVRPGVLRRPRDRRRRRRGHDLRRRRSAGHQRHDPGGHPGRHGLVHRTHLPAAHRADQRPRRHHELARQLRAGLRGPRRPRGHRRQAVRRRPRASPSGRIEFDHVSFRYPAGRRRDHRLAHPARRRGTGLRPSGAGGRRPRRGGRASSWRWSGRRAPASPPWPRWSRACTT